MKHDDPHQFYKLQQSFAVLLLLVSQTGPTYHWGWRNEDSSNVEERQARSCRRHHQDSLKPKDIFLFPGQESTKEKLPFRDETKNKTNANTMQATFAAVFQKKYFWTTTHYMQRQT